MTETATTVETKEQELFRIILLLENGVHRELLDWKPEIENWGVLKLSEEQIQGLTEAISTFNGEWVHTTGLDDLTIPHGPQLALTEQQHSKFWISGDPYQKGMWLRVVEVQVKPA